MQGIPRARDLGDFNLTGIAHWRCPISMVFWLDWVMSNRIDAGTIANQKDVVRFGAGDVEKLVCQSKILATQW